MEPILILAQPRSGSSMTAGIFAQHGVWTGSCRPPTHKNAKGFFENIPVRDILIETHGANVTRGELSTPVDGFKARVLETIVEDGYKGGPWLWKGSVLYWPAWFEFTPIFVVCRRDRGSIFKSCRKSHVFGKSLSDSALRENIAFHQEQMDYLVNERGALEVDTAAVANGDLTTIRKALEECGVRFNERATRNFVDADLWHH